MSMQHAYLVRQYADAALAFCLHGKQFRLSRSDLSTPGGSCMLILSLWFLRGSMAYPLWLTIDPRTGQVEQADGDQMLWDAIFARDVPHVAINGSESRFW